MWPWISKKDKSRFDIIIDGTKLQWNAVTEDWINTENSINEVGCIHTTQGYDLNYTGVIFGKEITYNKETKSIEIIKDNYFDKTGKQSIKNREELKNYIINIYKTIMLRGINGTYVYAYDPSLREYLSNFIEIADSVELKIPEIENIVPFVNSVPLYDLTAAAGTFGEQQRVEEKQLVAVPSYYKPSRNLFACRVVGESMNQIIPSGSICLFSKYSGGSRNGLIVLAEHTDIQDSDFGSNYTVKEYRSMKHQTEDGWVHTQIVLKPLTNNSNYEELILEEDDLKGFKIIGIFKAVLST